MTREYLQTREFCVGYDGKALIHDICLDIKKGEIITMIGPNGSGKSTILKTIARQLKIIGGKVTIAGEDLHTISHHSLAKKMAIVLTERIRPELMTCRDVVATGRYPFTGRFGILSKTDEQKVDEALKIVNATELADRKFDAISDGQRQRILLARAICQDPEIILLDEPTSYLDIRHKLELLSILRDMAKEKGIAVLMSLHEIDLAQKVSDKVLCVRGDVIWRFGTPEEVFTETAVRDLYDLDNGSYDPAYGSVELPAVRGEAEVLVLSNCGKGIPVYRKLQKEGCPFIAGILYTNDLDYPVAKHLAVNVITDEPFCDISEETYRLGLEAVHRCKKVIDAGCIIGKYNNRLAELLEEARKAGKLEKG